jgi:predicted metalloendopeptidase
VLGEMLFDVAYPDTPMQPPPQPNFSGINSYDDFREHEKWTSQHGTGESSLLFVANRTDWDIDPFTVNALYVPPRNAVEVPAAIFTPPFYVAGSPWNVAAIGAVLGHEMTHGFDTTGAAFDSDGNLANWWTPATAQVFAQRTGCLASLYSTFQLASSDTFDAPPQPLANVDGTKTIGENIADLGGVNLAHDVFTMMGPPAKGVAGFTPEQTFFVTYAQTWCTKTSAAMAKKLLASDVHAPGRFRVNGVLRDVPAFASAFACKSGQPMAPAARCSVW